MVSPEFSPGGGGGANSTVGGGGGGGEYEIERIWALEGGGVPAPPWICQCRPLNVTTLIFTYSPFRSSMLTSRDCYSRYRIQPLSHIFSEKNIFYPTNLIASYYFSLEFLTCLTTFTTNDSNSRM